MGMIWHNVTDDFRLILEGLYSEAHWNQAGSQESIQVSVGAFFSGRIFTSNILYI